MGAHRQRGWLAYAIIGWIPALKNLKDDYPIGVDG